MGGFDVLIRMTLKEDIGDQFILSEAQKFNPDVNNLEDVIELDLKNLFEENEYYGEVVDAIAVQVTSR